MTGDRLLTEAQVSEMIGRPVATLRTWRTRAGPGVPLAYVKTGRAVRYRASAVEAWIDANTVTPPAPRPRLARGRRVS